MDTSKIPPGNYCYTWKEYPSKDNDFKGKINLCPYYSSRKFNDVSVHWCEFLGLGGLTNDVSGLAINKLKKHFGGEDLMHQTLPLQLLFDQCKECGENVVLDDE